MTVVTAIVVSSPSANVLTISAIFTELVVVGTCEIDDVELSSVSDDVSMVVAVELVRGYFC